MLALGAGGGGGHRLEQVSLQPAMPRGSRRRPPLPEMLPDIVFQRGSDSFSPKLAQGPLRTTIHDILRGFMSQGSKHNNLRVFSSFASEVTIIYADSMLTPQSTIIYVKISLARDWRLACRFLYAFYGASLHRTIDPHEIYRYLLFPICAMTRVLRCFLVSPARFAREFSVTATSKCCF